jgi:hypothetical protein
LLCKAAEVLFQKNTRKNCTNTLPDWLNTEKSKCLRLIACLIIAIYFVGFKPSVLIADFIKEIKVESNDFINNKKWTYDKFNWQEGYGVFSYSHSQINTVAKYVLNQEQHHKKKTFRQEYHEFLKKFCVPFEEKYLFDFMD